MRRKAIAALIIFLSIVLLPASARPRFALVLSGGAQVDWKGDSYHASLIGLDLEEETVSLSGQIGGSIHG